jgi:hypothetical protein
VDSCDPRVSLLTSSFLPTSFFLTDFCSMGGVTSSAFDPRESFSTAPPFLSLPTAHPQSRWCHYRLIAPPHYRPSLVSSSPPSPTSSTIVDNESLHTTPNPKSILDAVDANLPFDTVMTSPLPCTTTAHPLTPPPFIARHHLPSDRHPPPPPPPPLNLI